MIRTICNGNDSENAENCLGWGGIDVRCNNFITRNIYMYINAYITLEKILTYMSPPLAIKQIAL